MRRARNDENLIGNLTEALAPVKRLPHPLWRIAPWIVFALGYTVFAVSLVGVRADIAVKLAQPDFVFEIFLLLTTGISAAIAVAWLCVPDMREQQWITVIPLSLTAVFLLWISVNLVMEGVGLEAAPFRCLVGGVLMGFLPAAAIVIISRRGATTLPGLMALMNIIAVSAFGFAGLRFTCPLDGPGHVFIWHGLPFAIGGALLGASARRLYRW